MSQYRWQFIVRNALLIALLLSTLVDQHAPAAFAQVDAVIVALTEDAPPFAWKNEQGELIGFAVDLMKLVEEETGIQVTYRTEQLRYLLPAIATHFYDIGGGCLAITPERQAWVNFSKPYFATGEVLVAQTQDTTITQLSDLSDTMTIGVIEASVAAAIARNQSQAVLIATTTAQESLAQLEAGKLNAVLTAESNFFDYHQSQPQSKLKTVGELLTYHECGFAVSKDKPELLAKLNIALTQLQGEENSRYTALYQKWFGQRPTPEKPTQIDSETLLIGSPPAPIEERGVAPPESHSPSTIVNTTNGSTTIITDVTKLVGIYYLKTELPTVVPSASVSTVGSSESETSNYQLITLAENGLWFISESITSTGATSGNSQPGLWQVNEQGQVEATLMVFDVSRESQTNVVRREYQMAIAADGSVAGHYTVTADKAEDFAQPVMGTPLFTETVEFTGKRVR